VNIQITDSVSYEKQTAHKNTERKALHIICVVYNAISMECETYVPAPHRQYMNLIFPATTIRSCSHRNDFMGKAFRDLFLFSLQDIVCLRIYAVRVYG
jgi:hypothetical protein